MCLGSNYRMKIKTTPNVKTQGSSYCNKEMLRMQPKARAWLPV